MSTFKDMVQEDIKSIFLDFDMFGENHCINGQEIMVIVDDNELTEREKRITKYDGELHNRQFLFYVSKEDFGTLPEPGRMLNFDGEEYRIMDAEDESGIYSISLEAIRS